MRGARPGASVLGDAPRARPLGMEDTLPLGAYTTVTPLGVRFWDVLTEAPIGDGLVVRARPCDGPERTRTAFRTRSDVHAFRELPGLRATEFPPFRRDDEPASDTPPPVSPPDDEPERSEVYALSVEDRAGRFNDTVLVLSAPRRGVARTSHLLGACPPDSPPGSGGTGPSDDSPPDEDPPIYLFSAPTRSLPPAVAVLRAQLVTPEGAAVAHAVLEVDVDLGAGGVVRHAGVSDATGAVLVAFPYPTFPVTVAPSPPAGTAGRPPREQCWELLVRVRHDPDALVFVAGFAVPTTTSVLGQATARIRSDVATTGHVLVGRTVCFGRETVLTTVGHPRSELLVDAPA